MTHVIVECRGKCEDEQLEFEFLGVGGRANFGRAPLPLSPVFADKRTSSTEMQFAEPSE